MATTCSAEFDDTPAARATMGRMFQDLLEAGRQFAVTPRFDTGPQGLHVVPGFIVSWPGAVPAELEAAPAPGPEVA
jgi:hypothetical protein